MIGKFLKRFSAYEMVDISSKEILHRTALAEGKVQFSEAGFKHLKEKGSSKGSIYSMAEIAGIMAAKETSRLLPLCHPVPVNKVKVEIELKEESWAVGVRAYAVSDAKTGVEMEALTAVSVSCLTIYDMCKNFEKNMVIQDVRLLVKEKEKVDKVS